MGKGMFVTLEGIDACGKSYLAHQLLSEFRGQNQDCTIVNWKESTIKTDRLSHFLREAVKTYVFLAEKMEEQKPSLPLMDLVSAAGFTVLWNEKVHPLVMKGVAVISDSWCFKGMARQIVNARLYGEPEAIKNYENWLFQVHNPALRIDYSFFIDTPVETCWERKSVYTVHETGKSIGFTGSDKDTFLLYQSELRSILLEFARKLGWHVLEGDTEKMTKAVMEVLYGKN